MVGVSIVLFALMGTIGVGYLLNGNTTYQTVDDYEYVTDVTGLYNYTPVAAYAPYSPAANNYQYSTVKADLGTYTSGISYTEAGAANLNPIVTPDTEPTSVTTTIAYADLPGTEYETNVIYTMGYDGSTHVRDELTELYSKIIPVRAVIGELGGYNSIVISTPNLNASVALWNNAVTSDFTFQPVGVYYPSEDASGDTSVNTLNLAISNNSSAAGGQRAAWPEVYGAPTSSIAGSLTTTGGSTLIYNNIPVGTINSYRILPNGTLTYTYSVGDEIRYITASVDSSYLIVYSNTVSNSDYSPIDYDETYTPGLTYTVNYYGSVDYLDPNYGVSTTANTVYWSNGNDIGSVQWLIKRPSATTAQTFTAYHADDTAASTFTVNYDTWWTLNYNGATINMGKAWDGVLITAYYTGELQWSPVRSFTNFTEYRLGNTTTIEASAPMNAAISYYTITKATGAPSFNFAVVGTSVASGTVPGAMFDASFNISNYFPQYDDVRVSFDSAAYVGTEVKVGTWTMDVDSGSFVGEFTIAGETYNVDLTKPWSINWTSADTVSITYTPYNKMGTKTVTILNQDAAKVVNLSGQWVIDTDLYEITSTQQPVYNWNFGHWGLAKVPFIVCVIGLIALLSIAYRIAGVNFHGLDYAVIALASLIIWVIL